MANLIEAGRLAAEHGAWVILPEADDEWNENPDKSDGTDDVGFLSQLITTATMLRPIDPKRSEEHTSELQSLMRISYAVFCLKKKNNHITYYILLNIQIASRYY